MKESANENINEQEKISGVQHRNDSLALNHSEDVTGQKQNGLVRVSYIGLCGDINQETSEELSIEKEICEWYEAGIDIEEKLENLITYGKDYIWDCKISLAEYKEPELRIENILEIKSCFLHIVHNENFYYSNVYEAAESIIDYCNNTGIPTPNEIVYVINGYYIKWNFETGFSGSEISLWKFIQKTLHGFFAKLGSNSTICEDPTVMLFVSGFKNSNYVGFDLCEEITTIYSNDELYASPSEFISMLPVKVSEVEEYKCEKKIIASCAKIISTNKNSAQKEDLKLVKIIAQNDDTRINGNETKDRAEKWLECVACALTDENCLDEEYRYYQYRATTTENTRRQKFYKWLEINGTGTLPKFDEKSDSWISAATYYSRFRRKGNVASINCNFLIINWKKSELEFTPTPEQGKELVLSRCHELGLPEPQITATPDGLEVKWYWNDRMTKRIYDHDPYNARFNNDWDAMQKKLYEKFWYLGADPKKLCVTVMFRIPGSKDTRKTLKKSADRIIREIHKGETVESYRDIQRILGLKETYCEEASEVLDEITKQKWERFSVDEPELAKDWLADVLRIHPSSKNWVCFGFIDENKKWNNRWTQAFELRKYLLKLIYRPEFTSCDFYISQGEFFSRNDRTVKNLASINVSFVDLDYKILVDYRPEITRNPSPEEWEGLIKAHCEKFGIPLPNDVVFSGGGVHLKWIYDEAISRSELSLWQYAQSLLLSQFKTLGADPASSDASRVLRLVGTQNHKDSKIINERTVHVIDREFFSDIKITLCGLIEGLENSQPENPEEYETIKSDWQKTLAQLSIKEENLLRPESERKIDYDSEEYRLADNYYWLESTLRHHKLHATYLVAEFSGVTKWIETYHLHETLRLLYGTSGLKLSLAELKEQECVERREAIEWIPCNYVMLSNCPGETFEEQKANIFTHCHNYRDVGIQEPNQIIKIGNTLLVEWTYQSVLTGRALSRWQDVQEFLCRYFADWGAMDKSEYLKATALLPVPGFEYDGEIARLEYSDLGKRYTFNRFAKAVLHFSQKEVEEYRKRKAEEKAKHEPARKIALPENISAKILNAPDFYGSEDKKTKCANFQIMARMRYADIVRWLGLQRDANGEIPQNTRELSVFWALVFAKQAGLITTYDEFKAKAEELIKFCGLQFSTECTVNTLKTAFTKNYCATTTYLIKTLRITPEAQKQMKVLLIGVRATAKKHQPREEWLAEHTQERDKPWEKLNISRATYFNWKKSGKLPAQMVEQEVGESPEKKLDWFIYIMSARIIEAIIRGLKQWGDVGDVLNHSCAFLVFEGSALDHTVFKCCSSNRSPSLRALVFLKCRRGKRRRKRRRREEAG